MVSRFTILLSAALVSSGFSTCRGSAEPGTTSQAGGQTTASGASAAARADVELPGVDTSSLTPRERRDWSAFVSQLGSPCADTPVSIAQCVKEKRSCGKCLPAAKYLVKQVAAGKTRDQANDAYKARFDNERVKNIDVSETPMKGAATAPITVVEWADFECPFCKRAAPVLEGLVEKFPGKVRFFFKVYPLAIHPHAEPAARAFVAATIQGKPWEMHHRLFEAPQGLEPANLEGYAKDLGLKVDQFKADSANDKVAERVNRDKKQAEALNFQGTPLIYINGREFEAQGGDFSAELDEWIKLELDLLGQSSGVVAPAPGLPGAASSAAGTPRPASSVLEKK